MTTKHVFIVSHYPMFGHGLVSLLHQKAHLNIVGQEKDLEQALESIKNIQPDVVIIDSDEPPYDSMQTVLGILKGNPKTRIIGLNLQNNTLYVYEARHRSVHNLHDLVTAIQHDFSLLENGQG